MEILTKKVDDLKLQVHNVTTNNYVDFYPNLATSRDLRDNLDQVSTEMQEVADKIENEVCISFCFYLILVRNFSIFHRSKACTVYLDFWGEHPESCHLEKLFPHE